MKSSVSSTNACVRLGTPELTLRVTHQRKPNASTPITTVVSTVSTLSVQKPPSLFTGCARNVRWWLMYSVGESASSEAAIGKGRSVADEQRQAGQQHGDHERRQERGQDDVLVRRQHEPQLREDHHDLASLRAE